MRSLPTVNSLQNALQSVIKSNKADGYPPNRFAQIVANTNSSELVQVCTALISSKPAFSEISNALLKHPNLLTLEDFVARHGMEWGFCEEAVEEAQKKSQWFDQLVGHRRYE